MTLRASMMIYRLWLTNWFRAVSAVPQIVRLHSRRILEHGRLYREGLKNRKTGKEASSNFRSGASGRALEHAASENEQFEEKPTLPGTDSSITSGILQIKNLQQPPRSFCNCSTTLGIALLYLMTGCYKNHLYVQQEWVDGQFLASNYVHTPDPLKANPPVGQRLLIGWDFPQSVFQRQLTLRATVRLWDQTEIVKLEPLQRRRDATSYFFPSDGDPQKKILTYLIEVVDPEGHVVETWAHHFWTRLIVIEK